MNAANQPLQAKLAVSGEDFLVIVWQKVGLVISATSHFPHHPTAIVL